jgi:type IV pilus assembly protein PilN
MKIPINLASQPFRRDRAIMAALAAAAVALVLTLGGLIYLYAADRAESAELRREVDRLDRQTAASGAEQARLEAILRKPENSTVMEDSVFINALLYHKGISWSRLFTDLENTVPYNVKLISLVPTINSRNVVVLDISVAAQDSKALVEFAMALERSAAFRDVSPHNTQPPTQSEPFYKGRVTVNYAQKL